MLLNDSHGNLLGNFLLKKETAKRPRSKQDTKLLTKIQTQTNDITVRHEEKNYAKSKHGHGYLEENHLENTALTGEYYYASK